MAGSDRAISLENANEGAMDGRGREDLAQAKELMASRQIAGVNGYIFC
jgi:hypothetical protein